MCCGLQRVYPLIELYAQKTAKRNLFSVVVNPNTSILEKLYLHMCTKSNCHGLPQVLAIQLTTTSQSKTNKFIFNKN